MNLILSIPVPVRLAAAALLGACVGGAADWISRRPAWNPRPMYRPRTILVALLAALGYAALYGWEIGAAGLLPPGAAKLLPLEAQAALHLQFAAHAVLIAWMLAASLIDIDEKIIPDEITISGTLVGLLLAAAWPLSLLPDAVPTISGELDLKFLTLTSPNEWPIWLNGAPLIGSLGIALACWWAWCAALLPRTWYSRHGWRRAAQLCWAGIVRDAGAYRILRMAIVGALAIALVWYRGGLGWEGLLTALVGMAAGGSLIWAVRIVGSAVLQREAMGFGDVTLMAMLGAFLGWQSCLVIFFLAPFAGLLVGLLRLFLFRDKEIPYGPFLCLASLFLLVRWDAVWNYTLGVFSLGWLVPLLMLCCLALMAAMLGGWRLILHLFR